MNNKRRGQSSSFIGVWFLNSVFIFFMIRVYSRISNFQRDYLLIKISFDTFCAPKILFSKIFKFALIQNIEQSFYRRGKEKIEKV